MSPDPSTDLVWYSNKTSNSSSNGDEQHVWAFSCSGAGTSSGKCGSGAGLPTSGVYISWEDLPASCSGLDRCGTTDWDYNDLDLVATNVTLNATPIPAALPLFAGGLGMMGLLGKRRKRKPAVMA